MTVLAWLLIFAVSFVALGLAAGPPSERRPHFWGLLVMAPLLVGCSVLLPLALTPATARTVMDVVGLLAIPALMFAPALLYRRPGPSSDTGEDDGGGSGRDGPPSAPSAPRGGIPLPDAEPANVRLRDHNRQKLAEAGPRRPSREPERSPVRRKAVRRAAG
jgi:hypothetical protein